MMISQPETILCAIAVLLRAVLAGGMHALEVLSVGRLDRDDDEEESDGFHRRFHNDPVGFGAALGVADSAAAVFAIVAAVGAASAWGWSALMTGFFAAAALLAPAFLSRIVALADAERFLKVVSPVLLVATLLIKPVAAALVGLVRMISPRLARMLAFEVVPLKEKIHMLGDSGDDGVAEEQRIMSSVIEFGETRVREVMVPRIDIVAVNEAMDPDEALGHIVDTGHSRIPVYRESIDNIIGTLHTQDLLRKIAAREDYTLRELARDAFFVPESKKIDELLTEFKRRRQHLAVVVDEYGGTAGIVTLEDVIEEIVGDIQDEFDAEEVLFVRIDADSAVCNAKINIYELNDALGTSLPDDDSDSLGGLLYQLIGHVPVVGDSVEVDGIRFEVQSVERQRIDKVMVRGLSALESQAEGGAGGP